MIKKILITLSILTFIFFTLFADSQGNQKSTDITEKENNKALKVNISLFAGLTKSTLKGFEKDELLLLECKPFNSKKELENHLNSLKKIDQAGLTITRFAYSESVPNTHELEKVNWMKDDIMMNVSLSESSGVSLPVIGKVSFFDTRDKKTHTKPFSLKKGGCIAALFKKHETLIVLALQLKRQQEIYHTEYRGEKFTVYCVDHSWSDFQMKADTIAFHKAKAIIPVNGGYLVLVGETIVYSKKNESLVASKGSLTQPDGTMYSTLGKITIPLNQPLEFKID